jgi:uncharacterized protein YrrD
MKPTSNNKPQPNESPPSAQTPAAQETTDTSAASPRLMTAQTLVGTRVFNRKDETLGVISDIMLELTRGSIAYVVVATGGFMGMGERLFAWPWYALIYDPKRQCCVLNADKATFDQAPGLDREHWPESPFDQGNGKAR